MTNFIHSDPYIYAAPKRFNPDRFDVSAASTIPFFIRLSASYTKTSSSMHWSTASFSWEIFMHTLKMYVHPQIRREEHPKALKSNNGINWTLERDNGKTASARKLVGSVWFWSHLVNHDQRFSSIRLNCWIIQPSTLKDDLRRASL